MKILIFMGCIIYPNRFYVYDLYREHLKTLGHQTDIYIYRIDQNNPKELNVNIFKSWKHLNPQQYDLIILVNILGKKKMDANFLKPLFQIYSNPVFYLKGCFNLEMPTMDHPRVIVGVPSLFFTKYDHFYMPYPRKSKIIRFPYLEKYLPNSQQMIETSPNLKDLDRSSSSYLQDRKKFCNKYGLNPSKKICVFFPGTLNRTHNYAKKAPDFINQGVTKANNLFKYWNSVLDEFSKNGYQLIAKFKVCGHNQSASVQEIDRKIRRLPILDDSDTVPALKYSEMALTTSTGFSYELYLYDLPCLDFGFGYYFLGWANGGFSKYTYNQQLKNKYPNGEIIYGHLTKLEETDTEPAIRHLIQNFANTKWNINQFPCLNDHPIIGETYHTTVDSICRSLLNLASCFAH